MTAAEQLEQDVVALARAFPHGIAALVRVFRHGATKHNGGQLGIAPGVTASDCVEHLVDHAHRSMCDGEGVRDRETGELDAAHAAARGVMTAQLVESVERGEVW